MFYLFSIFNWKTRKLSRLFEKFCHEHCEVVSSKVVSFNGVRKGVAIEDWDRMSDSMSRIKNNSCSFSWRVKGEDRLNCNIESRHLEFLEWYLCCFLSILLRVPRNYVQSTYLQWGGLDDIEIILWVHFQNNGAESFSCNPSCSLYHFR